MLRRSVTAFVAIALLAFGASEALASSPKAFDDDYDAALVASGDTQWLIVGGVDNRDTYGIKAFERSGAGAWRELPPLPGKHFNSSYGLHAVVQGEANPAPCFLYPLDNGPRLECLRNGAWEDALGTSKLKDANVEDLTAPTPDSMAVVYLKVFERQDRVLTYVIRSDSGGKWRQVGAPFKGINVAQFEASDVPGSLRVGVERMDNNAARRYVADVSGGKWVAATPIDRTPAGPFVGGPISLAGASYFPFTNAVTGPFTFGALALPAGATAWTTVGGGPLSDPAAAGQGSVAIADAAPWAIWQEDTPSGRSFNSAIRIANLAGTPVSPVTLWSGKRISPGPLDLVDAPGPAMYALYAQGTRKGLRMAVDEVSP